MDVCLLLFKSNNKEHFARIAFSASIADFEPANACWEDSMQLQELLNCQIQVMFSRRFQCVLFNMLLASYRLRIFTQELFFMTLNIFIEIF